LVRAVSVRTPYAELQDEAAKVERKLSAQGRAFKRWFAPDPIDHFQWRDPFAVAPAITETEEASR
jgi:hypothetical protein